MEFKKVDLCRIEEYFNGCERRLNNKFGDKGVVKLYTVEFEGEYAGSHSVEVSLNDNSFYYHTQTTIEGGSYKEDCDNHYDDYYSPCWLEVNDEQISEFNRRGTFFGKYSHLHTHEAILYAEERVGLSVYDVYEEFFSQFNGDLNKDYKITDYHINLDKKTNNKFYICYEYKGKEYQVNAYDKGERVPKFCDDLDVDLDILFKLIGEDVLSKYKR